MNGKDKTRGCADVPTDLDPGTPTVPDVIATPLAMLRAKTP
jgi:hypothetical protein